MPIYYHFLYLVASSLVVALAAGFYFKKPNDTVIRVFAVCGLSIAAWLMSIYAFYVAAPDNAVMIYLGRLQYVFGELIVLFAFLFAYFFPKKSYSMPRLLMLFITLETLVLCCVTFATGSITEYELVNGLTRSAAYGPLYPWFVIHFVAFAAGTIALFIHKFRHLKGEYRHQLLYLTYGWGLGLLLGAVTNIFLPWFAADFNYEHLGTVSALVFIGSTSYATARHKLFNMRIFAAELTVVFTSTVVLVVAATAPTTEYLIISLVSLVVTIGMGIFLISNVHRETTEREQLDAANRELALANAQLKEMDNIKNEFITMASHQLRTPISVVKGYLSLMLENAYGAVPEAIQDKLRQIYGLNERLVQMIDNMLNAARIEKRKIEYEVVNTDVLNAVRAVVEEMQIKADEKGISLTAAMPDQPVTAYFDEDKLHEVLVNLVDNAIKYTDKGGVAITVSGEAEDGFVSVTVKDSGFGMTPEEAGRVFTKFFRAKEAVMREPGTGLGLFICAKFMTGMGGEIGVVDTAPGEGTTFGLRLPISRPDNPEV